MMQLEQFTFNPFQENTYVLYDETGECVIIDPGCYDPAEKSELYNFIVEKELKPVHLLNTHCHIDHVLGNKFIGESFKLTPEIHPLEVEVLNATSQYGPLYGIYMEPSPEPSINLEEGGAINFGNQSLKMIFAPGHSPGSICFYNEQQLILIGGDVLFRESIGRADLPGGDMRVLLKSIREKLFILPDAVTVYPGHGPSTTIAHEKINNPFLQ
ncbi:MBL fold metallo-hydrolase [soil metagenome]